MAQTAIEAATRRLSLALDALEAAVGRRAEAAGVQASAAAQLHLLDTDRARLAAELDTETARAKRLEAANREIAQRLDAAMDNIRTVLDGRWPDEGFVAQVNVTINGRQFRMACEDGQEEHLHRLARELDERVEGLRGQFGEIGDARLTIMAALMIADQLSETEGRIRALEQDIANLKQTQAAGAEHANATQAAIINALNAAAERIESVTRRLNETGGGSGVAQG